MPPLFKFLSYGPDHPLKLCVVNYCSNAWGYGSRYQCLAEDIRRAVPSASVTGQVGRSGDFEVKIGEQLIFSKQSTGSFPDNKAVSDVMSILFLDICFGWGRFITVL